MQIMLQAVAIEEEDKNIISSLASYLSEEFHTSVNIAPAIKAPDLRLINKGTSRSQMIYYNGFR
jgi:hypothetical protein